MLWIWITLGVTFVVGIGIYGISCADNQSPFFPRLHYYRWARKYYPGCVKLNFKQFKEFYLLAPDKWEVPIKTFKECNRWESEYRIPTYRHYYNTVFFKTYRDYRRAMRWLVKYKKAMGKTNYQFEEYKNTAAFMKMIQQDIDRAQEEARHTANNTVKEIDKILESLKGFRVVTK